MVSYSIQVIVEYNQPGFKIICRQINGFLITHRIDSCGVMVSLNYFPLSDYKLHWSWYIGCSAALAFLIGLLLLLLDYCLTCAHDENRPYMMQAPPQAHTMTLQAPLQAHPMTPHGTYPDHVQHSQPPPAHPPHARYPRNHDQPKHIHVHHHHHIHQYPAASRQIRNIQAYSTHIITLLN